jgi:hypothetical protein
MASGLKSYIALPVAFLQPALRNLLRLDCRRYLIKIPYKNALNPD